MAGADRGGKGGVLFVRAKRKRGGGACYHATTLLFVASLLPLIRVSVKHGVGVHCSFVSFSALCFG